MSEIVPITIAKGDGVGPEIMEAVLLILKEVEANLRFETIEVGEKLYKKLYTSGIAGDTWESIDRTKILLKAPITTPQGGGYKSLNVTLRKTLGLFANVRPSVSYFPFVDTLYPNLDLVIIRENEEDLYAGIEYRQTHNVYESLKLISKVGSEKICHFAFEYALKNNRKKVTCLSKDNIMKFSDGIFHKVFDQVAKEYSDIKNEHYIIDIGTARLATQPEIFDVIVTSNLYGDIISDVAAEISGSVGMAGSANIGSDYAMFEAVHGSAPDIAGKNIANPSGLLNACIMMLNHIGHGSVAATIENAWKRTIEDGVHTADIYTEHKSSSKVGTKEFALEVIKRLGSKPVTLKPVEPGMAQLVNTNFHYNIDSSEHKILTGFDVYVSLNLESALTVAEKIKLITNSINEVKLDSVSAKGLKLWPSENKIKVLSDYWGCRFFASDNAAITHEVIAKLLENLAQGHVDFIKLENLYEYNGVKGYALLQGE